MGLSGKSKVLRDMPTVSLQGENKMTEEIADFQIQVKIEPTLRKSAYDYDGFFSCYKTLDYEKWTYGPCTYETLEILFNQILQELSRIIETQSSIKGE